MKSKWSDSTSCGNLLQRSKIRMYREGPLFELDSNKRWIKNAATIRVIAWTITEVRPGALGQILHPQETISGRPEQVYLPLTKIGMTWGGGALFESESNKHRGAKMRPLFKLAHGQLLKSSLGPLARHCIHQETIGGQLNRSIFHLTKTGMAWGGAIIRV